MNADFLQRTLEQRLRDDPSFAKLAQVLGLSTTGLVSMIVHQAIFPDDVPAEVPGRGGKPLLPAKELAGFVKAAVEAARAADPALFSDVKQQQLKVTQPGDPRTADPKLKSELDQLLRRMR